MICSVGIRFNATMSDSGGGLCGLFDDPRLLEAIASLGRVEALTVLAGAGTSIESGFPTWWSLVRSVLEEAATSDGLSATAAEQFADWTIRSEGLTAAAAVAEVALADRFEEAVHRALYPVQLTLRPGESAIAIARLGALLGREHCDIATTNYDLLLEEAHVEADLPKPAVHVNGAGRKLDRVLHLHGVVGAKGRVRGDLILSERDYFAMQDDTAWQQLYFADRLRASTCLFVGASLTDPNLLRYLYRTHSDQTHAAIFARQQDAEAYDNTSVETIAYREQTAIERWRAAGVNPIQVDTFSQSAQVLYEVLHYRRCKDRRRKYQPLGKRLHRWRRKIDQGITQTRPSAFASNQDLMHTMASQLLDAVGDDLRDAGKATKGGETLGMSVWIYDPATETLTNWASSDRIWRDPATLQPTPIDWTSDFASVQAFCTGSTVSWSTETYVATRWNHVVAAPLYMHDDGWGRLPVGAVTIGSTFNEQESALHRGLLTLRRKSIPKIAGTLAELLRPAAVTRTR